MPFGPEVMRAGPTGCDCENHAAQMDGSHEMGRFLRAFLVVLASGALLTAGDWEWGGKRNAATQHYDSRGTYLGKDVQSNSGERFYSKTGSYVGRADQRGDTVKLYDNHGRYLGQDKVKATARLTLSFFWASAWPYSFSSHASFLNKR